MAEYLREWLDGHHELSPKTAERYRELAEIQIIPNLGNLVLQRLKPRHVKDWHNKLLKSGGKNDRALSPRTVGHAHRVLHRALQMAVETEILARNVASAISPPKVEEEEIEILTEDQVFHVKDKLAGHPLYEIAVLDLGGAGSCWRSGSPTSKTKHGKRTISLPPNAVAVLREYRRKLLETRMAWGLGKPDADTQPFAELDGSPRRPDQLSWLWRSACKSLKLPRVSFHALRHTHASALIAAGLDVVVISRRLGHGSPHVTLRVYSHLFKRDDTAAAMAIEAAAMTRTRSEPMGS